MRFLIMSKRPKVLRFAKPKMKGKPAFPWIDVPREISPVIPVMTKRKKITITNTTAGAMRASVQNIAISCLEKLPRSRFACAKGVSRLQLRARCRDYVAFFTGRRCVKVRPTC